MAYEEAYTKLIFIEGSAMNALNLIQGFKKDGHDFSDIWADGLNQKLLMTLAGFAEAITPYGYAVEVCSTSSLEKLRTLSDERKLQIISSFETWCTFVQPVGSDGIVDNNLEKIEEKFLRRALEHYHLNVSEEFWLSLEKDSLIEIYGANMIQLYRSLNFFKISGYSLLDLSVHEWYVLYERPRRVIEDMNSHVKLALTEYIAIKPVETPRHVLREMFNTGHTEPFIPRAVFVDFKHIGTLRGLENANQAAGLIVTSKAEIIAEGIDAVNIQFV